ncbi:MAG TPA: helix-turn-helix transcriptional regulator [Acidobacteriota bacterium]|jgi:transcriptional regulator with XRE-family HTH domain|nr:helix-turn-helix transcriptional regulator [Acidobacteriota bacterium]
MAEEKLLRIRELAEQKGIRTIKELADRSHMAYSQVHAYWHGHVLQLNVRTLQRLAEALEVRVKDLFID